VNKVYLAITLLILASCGKDNDFLYRQVPHPPPAVEIKEVNHVLKESGSVDILWVIDNSGSMDPYQQDVITHTDKFINEFTSGVNIDWRMGLISSSEEEQPYLGFAQYNGQFFDYTDPNPVGTFTNAVAKLGTGGNYIEKFFGPSLQWISSDQFSRSDSFLAIIMISDEEEQTDGLTAKMFLDQLKFLKGGRDDLIKVYAAIASSDLNPPCPNASSNKYFGTPWEEIVSMTGGLAFSPCSNDFGSELAKVGKAIVDQLKAARILLGDIPKSDTIRVFFRGEELAGGAKELGGKWYFDETYNEIVFYDLFFAEGFDEEVQVKYEVENGFE
jgi:hypothetical protein